MKNDSNKKLAFTLAEVLITLTIIGVVAALTIPTLIKNYHEKVWDNAAKVFERKIEESMKIMNVNGTLVGHKTTRSFINELAKNIKIIKTCDPENLKDCIEENITWNILDISNGGSTSEIINLSEFKTAADLGKIDWGTETLGVQFANGTVALIAYNPKCKQNPYSNEITGMNCISIIYDTSGKKSPNTTGKDIRAYNNKIANCAFKSDNTCYSLPFNVEPMNFDECTGYTTTHSGTNVSTNAGGNAKTLGISKCYYAKDYWAGAVKHCGGVSKMASPEDVAKIASYVYNTTINSDLSRNNLDLDKEKVALLNLGPYDFFLWTNNEVNSQYASSRDFYSNSSYYGGGTREFIKLTFCTEK